MYRYHPILARATFALATAFALVCLAPSVAHAVDVGALTKSLKRQANAIKKHRASVERYKKHADAKKWKKYKEADKIYASIIKTTYKHQRDRAKVTKMVPMLMSAGSSYQTAIHSLYSDLGLKSGLEEFDKAMKELNKITFPKNLRR